MDMPKIEHHKKSVFLPVAPYRGVTSIGDVKQASDPTKKATRNPSRGGLIVSIPKLKWL